MDAAETRARIAANLQSVQAEIAAHGSGRETTLVCVTKYAPLEHAAALIEAGAQHIGENHFSQAADRFNELRARGLEFNAHMLGPLQSRKARLCAQSCDWYQALERVEMAHKLQAELEALGRTMNVLIQVHIGEEETKHGVAPDKVEAFIEELVGADLASARSGHDKSENEFNSAGAGKLLPYDTRGRVRLRGLMCIPPGPSCFLSPQVYEATTRVNFRQMAALFARIQAGYPELPIDTLSMGMSGDFRWAIEEGATMVRIGRALFEGLS